MSFARMSYVLEQTKQQQVLALAQLGWTVSRIAAAVHVDRATVTRYMRAAGLAVRGRGRPSEGTANAAISGNHPFDKTRFFHNLSHCCYCVNGAFAPWRSPFSVVYPSWVKAAFSAGPLAPRPPREGPASELNGDRGA